MGRLPKPSPQQCVAEFGAVAAVMWPCGGSLPLTGCKPPCLRQAFRCTEPVVSDRWASHSAVGATSCKLRNASPSVVELARTASPRVAELRGVVEVWKPSEDQAVRSLAEGGLCASLDVPFAIVTSPESKPRNAVLTKLTTLSALGLTSSTVYPPQKSAGRRGRRESTSFWQVKLGR